MQKTYENIMKIRRLKPNNRSQIKRLSRYLAANGGPQNRFGATNTVFYLTLSFRNILIYFLFSASIALNNKRKNTTK